MITTYHYDLSLLAYYLVVKMKEPSKHKIKKICELKDKKEKGESLWLYLTKLTTVLMLILPYYLPRYHINYLYELHKSQSNATSISLRTALFVRSVICLSVSSYNSKLEFAILYIIGKTRYCRRYVYISWQYCTGSF